jgi:hypothetical protein
MSGATVSGVDAGGQGGGHKCQRGTHGIAQGREIPDPERGTHTESIPRVRRARNRHAAFARSESDIAIGGGASVTADGAQAVCVT